MSTCERTSLVTDAYIVHRKKEFEIKTERSRRDTSLCRFTTQRQVANTPTLTRTYTHTHVHARHALSPCVHDVRRDAASQEIHVHQANTN